MKTSSRMFFVSLFITAVLPSLISGTSFYFLKAHQQTLFVQPYSFLIFLLLSVFTMALALTPTTFIAIISGYFFGWSHFPGVIAAYLLASVIGLWLGKLLAKQGIKMAENKTSVLSKLLAKLNDDQFLFIFLARLSPLLPFAMTNIALASLDIKLRKYLPGTLCGMLPRTLIFFYTGTQARNIWNFIKHPDLQNGLQYIPMLLIIISSLGLVALLKRELNKIYKTPA